MSLPETIQIFTYSINTFGLFLLLGYLLTAFAVWQEGSKDGFDEEKIFDLLIVSTLSAVLFSRLFYALSSGATFAEALTHTYRVWTPGMGILGGFIGLIAPIYLLCKRWKWSSYRIFDIFSLAWSLGLSIVMLGYVGLQQKFEFLFAFAAWLLTYTFLIKIRNSKIRSGAVFSIFLGVNVGLGAAFFRESRYLLFYLLLVTISAVNLYFRERKAASKTYMLSKEFIENAKNKLLKKAKDLNHTENLLNSEDPYLQEGREDDNADLSDDTAEDIDHGNVAARLSAVQAAKTQVYKALKRIKEGSYGKDEDTGETIPKERLEIYPEATTTADPSESDE